MYGMLFQVVVQLAIVVDDQVIHRDEYLERNNKKKEDYKNMSESERYKHDVRTMLKGCRT